MSRPAATLLLLLAAGGAIVATSCSEDARPGGAAAAAATATFVGRAACAKCHEAELESFRGSHHDLAMQEANAETVLGDFDDAEFTHHGVTSRFSERDGRFVVRTDGPDGELSEYEIAYTFGVTPLQQYLVAFPGGRYQTLPLCWDTRPAEQGGQRWFHVYGDEPIPHTDELHWTGPAQNWNYMCAGCHSTNLQKGFDVAKASYHTTWSEIDVSCEACHGRGSHHVEWAEAGADKGDAAMGLVVRPQPPHLWLFEPGAVTARREPPLADHTEVETCGPCHSRRSVLDERPNDGRPLHDAFRVSLLDEGLYHADGQILDEVYVYGSFAQSKMYRAGVQCTDCHDPHTLQLRVPGNAMCSQCHLPTTFETKAHHMHEPGSDGAQCVACHMPTRNYMVIDARRDHSIRIPRPDLTAKLGTPNACNGCHTDKDASWAAAAIRSNRPDYEPRPHYGEAIDAGRKGSPGAMAALARLLADGDRPAIARATAASLLGRFPGRETVIALETALSDTSDEVRTAAVGALDGYPPELLVPLASRLLTDPVRSVRVEAARVLAGTTADDPAATEEYVATQLANADQPWAHVNIGLVRTRQHRYREATAAYETALRIDPGWTPAWANLADLHREQQRDDLGEKVLRDGLGKARQTAPLHHALGLLLARTGRTPEALVEFERAANERPDDPRYSYTFAVALHSTGEFERAVQLLEQTDRRHPRERDVLAALATFHRDAGETGLAIAWAQRLVAAFPDDDGARALLASLQNGR